MLDKTELLPLVQELNAKYTTSLTAEMYDQCIQEFIDRVNALNAPFIFRKKTDLKTILEEPSFSHLLHAFWSLNIHDYLLRSKFIIKEGVLITDSKMEQKLYENVVQTQSITLSSRANSSFIPFRDDYGVSKNFYSSGTPSDATERLLKEHHHFLINEPLKLNFSSDFYQTIQYAFDQANSPDLLADSEGFSYILSAAKKDGHIYPILHIIDKNKSAVLAHYFINTSNSKDYYNYTKDRSDYMHKQDLSRNLEKANNAHNPEHTQRSNSSIPPFFNLSIDIQTNEDDKNCGIYTLLFLNEIVNLWKSSQHPFSTLARHAKNYISPSENRFYNILLPFMNAPDPYLYTHPSMVQFTNALKSRLPSLFDNEGKPHSGNILRTYFLKMRWLISCDHIYIIRLNAQKELGIIRESDISPSSNIQPFPHYLQNRNLDYIEVEQTFSEASLPKTSSEAASGTSVLLHTLLTSCCNENVLNILNPLNYIKPIYYQWNPQARLEEPQDDDLQRQLANKMK